GSDDDATVAIDAPTAWSMPVPESRSSDAPELSPGDTLGKRYEIIRMLGEGGMGAVYQARDTELDRMVALKVGRPKPSQNPDMLGRFKQELILTREVTHRNVIRIFDLIAADGLKFITMEFIEGRDLRSILTARRKLPPQEAAHIIQQVAQGLEA